MRPKWMLTFVNSISAPRQQASADQEPTPSRSQQRAGSSTVRHSTPVQPDHSARMGAAETGNRAAPNLFDNPGEPF